MGYEQSVAVQIPYCVQLIVDLMYRIMCLVGRVGSNKYGGVRVDVYTLLYVPRREQLPRNAGRVGTVLSRWCVSAERCPRRTPAPGSRLPPRCFLSTVRVRCVSACHGLPAPSGGRWRFVVTQNGAIHGDASRLSFTLTWP